MLIQKFITATVAVACLIIQAACTQGTAPAPQTTDNHAADEANVRVAVNTLKDAIRKRDVDAILSLYADDGWQLTESGAIARTAVERRAFWQAIVALPIANDIVDVAERIEVGRSGDVAVQYGEFRQIITDAAGNLESVPQKFMNSWRKQADGSWKVSASMATVSTESVGASKDAPVKPPAARPAARLQKE
jgi:ketosteroid isomerase-like protein